MFLHSDLLRLSGDIRDRVAIGALIGLGICAADLAVAVLSAHVLAQVIDGDTFATAIPLLGGILVAIATHAVLVRVREVSVRVTGQVVKRRVRRRVFDHMIRLGPGGLMRERTGALQSTAVQSIEALEPYCARYLPTFIVAVVSSIAVVSYVAVLDVMLAALLLAFILATPLMPQLWAHRMRPRDEQRWQLREELASDFLDSAQGVTTLKIFNAAEAKRTELARRSVALHSSQMRVLSLALLVESLALLGTLGGASAVIAVGAIRVGSGSLDALTLLTVLLLARESFRPWQELGTYWHMGLDASAGAERIVALLDTQPEVTEPAHPVPIRAQEIEPTIAFEDVTFSYDSRDRPAVRDMSFTVDIGETVALVGPSGSGKTTIVSLALRWFDPQAGTVRLGGHNLRELSLSTVREAVAVVSQDTYLFTGSIADNIRLARADASDEEVEAAARDADIAEFIASLPEGYETAVSERGLSLSGGQRQRIAIARAFLKDAPILVLDEATSNVDAASEAAIQRAVARLTANRTALVIAHRLSTIRNADRILVVADGVVTESGRHGELIARREHYARLVAAQGAA